jgi:hypothetical protein
VLLSPAVLLKNALGFTLVASSMPATTTATWICLVGMVIGAFALAWWVFLRAQGVETWETTSRQRWTITLAIVAMVLLPVLIADTDYDAAAPRPTNAPAIRGLFSRAGTTLALVPPGGRQPTHCCSTILNRAAWPFGTDARTQQDLLLLLPVEATQAVTDLRIQVAGENGLEATSDPDALVRAAHHLETRTYAGDQGPAAPDGHRVVSDPAPGPPTCPTSCGSDRRDACPTTPRLPACPERAPFGPAQGAVSKPNGAASRRAPAPTRH